MKTKNETKITAEKGTQEYFIVREFDAPREMVFKAFTDPKLVVQWLGPRDLIMHIETYEARKGGSYRYSHSRGKDKYWFSGVFHDCIAPEKIIQTFEFEGLPEKGHACLSTATFEALGKHKTKVVIQDVYQSVADRDAALASGMEDGIMDSNARLDELFERLLK